jgi:hypothetical protein
LSLFGGRPLHVLKCFYTPSIKVNLVSYQLECTFKKMRSLLFYLFLFSVAFLSSQPITIKVKKEKLEKNDRATDSVFYDHKERSLYSKTSGYENRFNTLKLCHVNYESKKKSGTIVLHSNKLSESVVNLFYERAKKMIIKFNDITLKADSLNSQDRKCPSIIITVLKKRVFRFAFGPRFSIPWPFPHWRTFDTLIEYGS